MFFSAALTLEGLYNYDKTLFDTLVLPDGVDKETLVQTLLFTAGDRNVVYASAPRFKQLLATWCAVNQLTWKKLLYTTTVEYDPIANYDRKEKWTDTTKRDLTNKNNVTRSDSVTQNRNDTLSGTSAESENGNNDRKIPAYNDTSLSTAEKLDSIKSINTTSKNTNISEGSETRNGSDIVNGSEIENVQVIKEGSARGNIGVTTTQQMIESERAVVQFNIYDYIAGAFCQKFIVGVW